jgi:hypothetical protein
MNEQQMYFSGRDDFGYSYLIPEELKEQWSRLLHMDEEDHRTLDAFRAFEQYRTGKLV